MRPQPARFRRAAILAALFASIASTLQAQTLTLAVSAAPISVDPHFSVLTPNVSLASHSYDALINRDAQSKPVPGLALSWKMLDETTWEFKLRPSVKFHNGDNFTAEDVAHTIARVPKVVNSPGSFAIYTRPFIDVTVVDPLTVRLKTATMHPLAPVDLREVKIIPRATGPAPATEDFNNGKLAIGTGPYRLVSFRPGDRAELERNDAYWGPKPHWQRIAYRFISNDGARTAALLAGDVTIIEAVPTTDAARLRNDPRVRIAETLSSRLVYLWLDRSRTGPTPFVQGPNGETLDKNPLNDLRVRQALSMAINRAAITERVMENAAIPSAQFLPPGSFSYVPSLKPPTFDPQMAKKLLADAGYPNGLRVTLHGPNDRYVNDGKIIQAVGQMWTRIGVQTQVEPITFPNFISRAMKLEFSTFLLGWGTSSGEASNPLRALVATVNPERGRGSSNRGRYSNPALDALIEKAMVTADDVAREKLLQDATRMTIEDVAFIPLHNQMNIWGMSPKVTYTARQDEETHAMSVRLAP
ncbi:MAG: ABC transporter substrate-binding protein [Acetobacteraceae bacterium]|nr:ABC transporter substrate-binding protein [Acetobacteraceae bacterium]MSP31178.1 ABC transporter substrate-binding protein [Acetobacteraceae bacterium]